MKRATDILISVIVLAVFAPVLALTALLIRIKLGSPVLFKQERPGKDGRVFVMVKFRTMKEPCDVECEKIEDSERLTRFGKILRATSKKVLLFLSLMFLF